MDPRPCPSCGTYGTPLGGSRRYRCDSCGASWTPEPSPPHRTPTGGIPLGQALGVLSEVAVVRDRLVVRASGPVLSWAPEPELFEEVVAVREAPAMQVFRVDHRGCPFSLVASVYRTLAAHGLVAYLNRAEDGSARWRVGLEAMGGEG